MNKEDAQDLSPLDRKLTNKKGIKVVQEIQEEPELEHQPEKNTNRIRKRPTNQPGRQRQQHQQMGTVGTMGTAQKTQFQRPGRQHTLATSPIRTQQQRGRNNNGNVVVPTRPTIGKSNNNTANMTLTTKIETKRIVYEQPKEILVADDVTVTSSSVHMPATERMSSSTLSSTELNSFTSMKKTPSEIELDILFASEDGLMSGGSSLAFETTSQEKLGGSGPTDGGNFVAGNITDALGSAPDVVHDPANAEDAREPSQIVEVSLDQGDESQVVR